MNRSPSFECQCPFFISIVADPSFKTYWSSNVCVGSGRLESLLSRRNAALPSSARLLSPGVCYITSTAPLMVSRWDCECRSRLIGWCVGAPAGWTILGDDDEG